MSVTITSVNALPNTPAYAAQQNAIVTDLNALAAATAAVQDAADLALVMAIVMRA